MVGYVIVISQDEYDILVITQSEVKRGRVLITRISYECTWLISQKTVPISASFVKQQAMTFGYVHLSKLS